MASNALLLSLLVIAIANVHSLKVNDTLIRIIFTGTNHIMMKIMINDDGGGGGKKEPASASSQPQCLPLLHGKTQQVLQQQVSKSHHHCNSTLVVREEYKHRYRTFRKNMQRVKLLQETEQVGGHTLLVQIQIFLKFYILTAAKP